MNMLNVMPNMAYSACLNREFLQSEKALEQEEKHFHKDLEQLVNKHYPNEAAGYKPLGFDQRDEDEEEEEEDEEEDDEEEEDIDMANSDEREEFDDYAEELETSDVEGVAAAPL